MKKFLVAYLDVLGGKAIIRKSPEEFFANCVELFQKFPQKIDTALENFENYKDLTHYSGKISSRMVTAMKTREFQLTPENREDHLRKLQSQIASFDYQKEFDRLKQTYRK